ncbi:protein kinase [Embleya sp. NPDC127516]|uniref:serine/threonine-protein kinase n=1 Tax=Embleya sp. NPDC127516 TaxID=3363990 RepID=UPI0037FFC605
MTRDGAQPLEPGDPERIGGYRLVARLGHGGMGRVFLAEDDEGHRVAVKVVHAEFAADPDFRTRFRREVNAAEQVLSYFTVPLVDSGPEAETPWLATQFVDGPALGASVRRDGPLPIGRLCTLAAALGEALIVIHAAGIVHRDLKPSNVLMADDGPRVIDFGIARAADDDELTRTGAALGTLGYASPEQLTGDEPVGAPGDVFALGGVLLFAATGREPFGDGPQAAVVFRTVHQAPDLTGVPLPLRDLVASCLAKDPGRRPTPREVIAAARAAQSRLGKPPRSNGGADAVPPVDERVTPVADDRDTSAPFPPARTRRLAVREGSDEKRAARISRSGVLAFGVVALILCVLAGMWLIRPDNEERSQPRTGAQAGKPSGARVEGVIAAGDRRRVWTAYNVDKSVDTRLWGVWSDDNVIVRIDAAGVRGYEARTGRQLWIAAPPAPDLVPCHASDGNTATSDGVGVIVFGKPFESPTTCEEAAAYEMATGRLLWHHTVGRPDGPNLAAMHGDVATVAAEDGIRGFDRSGGVERWRLPWREAGCERLDVTLSRSALRVRERCEDPRLTLAYRVLDIDPATGRVRGRIDLPAANSTLKAETFAYETEPDGVVFVRPDGGKTRELPLKQPFGTISTLGFGDADTYVTTADKRDTSGGMEATEIVALDAASGTVRWHLPLVTREEFAVLAIRDGSVFTIERTSTAFDRPDVRVQERRLRDGSVAATGTLPQEFVIGSAERVVAAGTLVIAIDSRSRPGLVGYDVTPG